MYNILHTILCMHIFILFYFQMCKPHWHFFLGGGGYSMRLWLSGPVFTLLPQRSDAHSKFSCPRAEGHLALSAQRNSETEGQGRSELSIDLHRYSLNYAAAAGNKRSCRNGWCLRQKMLKEIICVSFMIKSKNMEGIHLVSPRALHCICICPQKPEQCCSVKLPAKFFFVEIST